MPLHLVKLCVGASSLDDLKAWVRRRTRQNQEAGRGRVHDHVTRMRPRRESELLDGGSLYWVIKGVTLCRQDIIRLEARPGADGVARTSIVLRPKIVPTEPQPRRAFQGWRYLAPDDAPADLGGDEAGAAPPELRMALAELGLL